MTGGKLVFIGVLLVALMILFLQILSLKFPNLYSLIKDWQTLIAGLVGFGGIAWVTFENARLQRWQSAEQEKSLAIAITSEASHLCLEIVTLAKRLDAALEPVDAMEKSIYARVSRRLNKLPEFRIYEENLEKVTTLPSDVLHLFMEFYFTVMDIRDASYEITTKAEAEQCKAQLVWSLESARDLIRTVNQKYQSKISLDFGLE